MSGCSTGVLGLRSVEIDDGAISKDTADMSVGTSSEAAKPGQRVVNGGAGRGGGGGGILEEGS